MKDLGNFYPAIDWIMRQGHPQQIEAVSAFTPTKMVSADVNVYKNLDMLACR